MSVPSVVLAPPAAPSLVSKIASRFSVDPTKLLATLKQTAFRSRSGAPEPSDAQMMSLLIVADQYGLNPFTGELFAFPDKNNGIVPVVGVDGWARIVNEHPQYDGVEFVEADVEGADVPRWIECVMHRKDRAHATRVREYFSECKRGTAPWSSHPRRMLRHKAFIQCARVAFGFVGIYDVDEAERIVEGSATFHMEQSPALDAINKRVSPPAAAVAALDAMAEDAQKLGLYDDPVPLPTVARWFDLLAECKNGDAVDVLRDLIANYDDAKVRDEMITASALRVADFEPKGK